MINSAAEEQPVTFSHPNTVSPLNVLFFLLLLTTNPTKHTVPCLPAVKHNWIAGKDKHEEMFADKITSKNNSASQWDNGVSRLRVCVHRFTVDLFACAQHQHVHTLTLWQLCATFQRSAEVWANWILSSGFIDICLSKDQKADTSRALKPHSWQQRSVRASSFIWLWDNAWLFYLPSAEEDKRNGNTLPDSNLYYGVTIHSQRHLQCFIISPVFVIDAKFSFFLIQNSKSNPLP